MVFVSQLGVFFAIKFFSFPQLGPTLIYFAILRLIDDICTFHFAWEIRRECGFFKLWSCGPGHHCLRKWRDLHDIDFEKFIGASLATEKGHWEGPRY